MRGLMRLLFMFGPMILRQVQKYQRNKQRDQYQQQRGGGYPQRQAEPRRNRRRQEAPAPPPEPKMSEEERNFRLNEDEIMLDNETMQDYKSKHSGNDSHEMDYKDQANTNPPPRVEDPIVSEDEIVPSGKVKKEVDDGFDLKDLFFEDEEEKES